MAVNLAFFFIMSLGPLYSSCSSPRHEKLKHVLENLIPKLRIKRRQAELLLEYISIHSPGNRWYPVSYSQRELEIYEELRKLNTKMARYTIHASHYVQTRNNILNKRK